MDILLVGSRSQGRNDDCNWSCESKAHMEDCPTKVELTGLDVVPSLTGATDYF